MKTSTSSAVARSQQPMKKAVPGLTAALIALITPLFALSTTQTSAAEQAREHYSPFVGRSYPENLYWGDTHVHSNLSMDAYTMGNRAETPETAYRFARGETVTSTSGQLVRLSRPLDFLVLSDHAEWLGLFRLIGEKDARALATGPGKRWAGQFETAVSPQLLQDMLLLNTAGDTAAEVARLGVEQDPQLLQTIWHRVTATADKFNEPGKFTAFIGYEWTSMPNGDNLHRNVIFRDDAALANQVLPFASTVSQDPEDLWSALADYEDKTGGRVLAIPHNANGSNGGMFLDKTYRGGALTTEYAEQRRRWEPLVEVTQIKGDAESHPYLSPDDRFADFETWDQMNFGMTPKEDWMLRHEYARGALKLGLELEKQLGVNPFKFGMIGSSDTHTSLAAVEENNFIGKFANEEPAAGRMTKGFNPKRPNSMYSAGGYVGVWAHENTRASLFDAMERREVYATTGPRMQVRVFGGWGFAPGDHTLPGFVSHGYAGGVPMGGDLPAPAGATDTPRLLIAAIKDPESANLERIQVVKGWLDEDGASREKVYDVALSDGRTPDGSGALLPPVASTVDVKTATYRNSVGASHLAAVWEDPDFDPSTTAFYYVRVMEIPTPRWTTIDAVFFDVPLPENVPAEIQERAYTSPIWYTP